MPLCSAQANRRREIEERLLREAQAEERAAEAERAKKEAEERERLNAEEAARLAAEERRIEEEGALCSRPTVVEQCLEDMPRIYASVSLRCVPVALLSACVPFCWSPVGSCCSSQKMVCYRRPAPPVHHSALAWQSGLSWPDKSYPARFARRRNGGSEKSPFDKV